MGCFTACFRHLKHKKTIKSRNNNATTPSKNQCLQRLLQTHDNDEVIVKEAQIDGTIKPIADSNEDEEQLNRSSRKEVTFDLNVKTYEEFPNQENEKSLNKEVEPEISSDSSLISFPLNHRYHNCKNGDDELENSGFDDIDLQDDDDGVCACNENELIQEESSESSLFSLSIESRKRVNTLPDKEEVISPFKPLQNDNAKAIGLNPNSRENTQFARSVLNPIENMTQWESAKVETTSPLEEQPQEKDFRITQFARSFLHPIENMAQWESAKAKTTSPLVEHPQEKENHNLELEPNSKNKENKIAVDTSLSSWLPNSKDSSGSIGNSSPSDHQNSPNKFEGRPILGEMSVEELKFSSTPRRSTKNSTDDMAIIGTVGSYWRHTGQATDSDSGSSSCRGILSAGGSRRGQINQSTPFQIRLESVV